MGTAPQADNSALQPQQGKYWNWAMPAGWSVNESERGISLTSPDGIYEVGHSFGITVLGNPTPRDWFQSFGQQYLKDFRILSVQNLPDQGTAYGPVQGIEAIFSYTTPQGMPLTCKRDVMKTHAGQQGMEQSSFLMYGYCASNDKIQDAQSFLSQIDKSIVLTNAAGNNPSPAPNNPSNSEEIMKHWQSQNNIQDNTHRKAINGIQGTVDLVGPNGERTHTWNQGNYAWKDPRTGKTVWTDTNQSPGYGYDPQTRR